MCTKGSSRARSTPWNARRTGKPSPSKPLGALLTDTTGRSTATARSGSEMRGSASGSETVTAGITATTVERSTFFHRSDVRQLDDVPRGIGDEGGQHSPSEVDPRRRLPQERHARGLQRVDGVVEGVGGD